MSKAVPPIERLYQGDTITKVLRQMNLENCFVSSDYNFGLEGHGKLEEHEKKFFEDALKDKGKFAILPFNLRPNHWVLCFCIFDEGKKSFKILYFDSLKNDRQTEDILQIRDFIRSQLPQEVSMEEILDISIEMQKGFFNCGPILIETIEILAKYFQEHPALINCDEIKKEIEESLGKIFADAESIGVVRRKHADLFGSYRENISTLGGDLKKTPAIKITHKTPAESQEVHDRKKTPKPSRHQKTKIDDDAKHAAASKKGESKLDPQILLQAINEMLIQEIISDDEKKERLRFLEAYLRDLEETSDLIERDQEIDQEFRKEEMRRKPKIDAKSVSMDVATADVDEDYDDAAAEIFSDSEYDYDAEFSKEERRYFLPENPTEKERAIKLILKEEQKHIDFWNERVANIRSTFDEDSAEEFRSKFLHTFYNFIDDGNVDDNLEIKEKTTKTEKSKPKEAGKDLDYIFPQKAMEEFEDLEGEEEATREQKESQKTRELKYDLREIKKVKLSEEELRYKMVAASITSLLMGGFNKKSITSLFSNSKKSLLKFDQDWYQNMLFLTRLPHKILSSISGMNHNKGLPDLEELSAVLELCKEYIHKPEGANLVADEIMSYEQSLSSLFKSVTGMQDGKGLPDKEELRKFLELCKSYVYKPQGRDLTEAETTDYEQRFFSFVRLITGMRNSIGLPDEKELKEFLELCKSYVYKPQGRDLTEAETTDYEQRFFSFVKLIANILTRKKLPDKKELETFFELCKSYIQKPEEAPTKTGIMNYERFFSFVDFVRKIRQHKGLPTKEELEEIAAKLPTSAKESKTPRSSILTKADGRSEKVKKGKKLETDLPEEPENYEELYGDIDVDEYEYEYESQEFQTDQTLELPPPLGEAFKSEEELLNLSPQEESAYLADYLPTNFDQLPENDLPKAEAEIPFPSPLIQEDSKEQNDAPKKDHYAEQEREMEDGFQEVLEPLKSSPEYSFEQQSELTQLKMAEQSRQFLKSDEYQVELAFDGDDLSKKHKEVDLVNDDLDDENSLKQKRKKTDLDETNAIQALYVMGGLSEKSQITDSTQRSENLPKAAPPIEELYQGDTITKVLRQMNPEDCFVGSAESVAAVRSKHGGLRFNYDKKIALLEAVKSIISKKAAARDGLGEVFITGAKAGAAEMDDDVVVISRDSSEMAVEDEVEETEASGRRKRKSKAAEKDPPKKPKTRKIAKDEKPKSEKKPPIDSDKLIAAVNKMLIQEIFSADEIREDESRDHDQRFTSFFSLVKGMQDGKGVPEDLIKLEELLELCREYIPNPKENSTEDEIKDYHQRFSALFSWALKEGLAPEKRLEALKEKIGSKIISLQRSVPSLRQSQINSPPLLPKGEEHTKAPIAAEESPTLIEKYSEAEINIIIRSEPALRDCVITATPKLSFPKGIVPSIVESLLEVSESSSKSEILIPIQLENGQWAGCFIRHNKTDIALPEYQAFYVNLSNPFNFEIFLILREVLTSLQPRINPINLDLNALGLQEQDSTISAIEAFKFLAKYFRQQEIDIQKKTFQESAQEELIFNSLPPASIREIRKEKEENIKSDIFKYLGSFLEDGNYRQARIGVRRLLDMSRQEVDENQVVLMDAVDVVDISKTPHAQDGAKQEAPKSKSSGYLLETTCELSSKKKSINSIVAALLEMEKSSSSILLIPIHLANAKWAGCFIYRAKEGLVVDYNAFYANPSNLAGFEEFGEVLQEASEEFGKLLPDDLFINLHFQDLPLAIADNAVKNSALLTTKAFELLKDYYAQQEREAEENFLQLVTERFQEVADPSKALPKYSLTQKGELAQLKIAAQYQQFLESDEYRRGAVFDGGSDLSKKRKEVDLGDDLDGENSSKQKHKKTDFNETSANTSLDEALAIQEFFNINPLLKQSQIPDSTQKYENLSDWIKLPSPALPQENQELQDDKSPSIPDSSVDIEDEQTSSEENLPMEDEEELSQEDLIEIIRLQYQRFLESDEYKKDIFRLDQTQVESQQPINQATTTATAESLPTQPPKPSAIAEKPMVGMAKVCQLSSIEESADLIYKYLLKIKTLPQNSALFFPIELPNGQLSECFIVKLAPPAKLDISFCYQGYFFDPSTNPSELTENHKKLNEILAALREKEPKEQPANIHFFNFRSVILGSSNSFLQKIFDSLFNYLDGLYKTINPNLCKEVFKPMQDDINKLIKEDASCQLANQDNRPIRLEILAKYHRFLASDKYRQTVFGLSKPHPAPQVEDQQAWYKDLPDKLSLSLPASPQKSQELQDEHLPAQDSPVNMEGEDEQSFNKEDSQEILSMEEWQEQEQQEQTTETNPQEIKAATAESLPTQPPKPAAAAEKPMVYIAKVCQLSSIEESADLIYEYLLKIKTSPPNSALLLPIQLPNGKLSEYLITKSTQSFDYHGLYFDPSTNKLELAENLEKLSQILAIIKTKEGSETPIKIGFFNFRIMILELPNSSLQKTFNGLFGYLENIYKTLDPDLCEKVFKPMKDIVKLLLEQDSLLQSTNQSIEFTRLAILSRYQQFLESDKYRETILRPSKPHTQPQDENQQASHKDFTLGDYDLGDYALEYFLQKGGDDPAPSASSPNSSRLKQISKEGASKP